MSNYSGSMRKTRYFHLICSAIEPTIKPIILDHPVVPRKCNAWNLHVPILAHLHTDHLNGFVNWFHSLSYTLSWPSQIGFACVKSCLRCFASVSHNCLRMHLVQKRYSSVSWSVVPSEEIGPKGAPSAPYCSPSIDAILSQQIRS